MVEYDKGFKDGLLYAYNCMEKWMIFSDDVIQNNLFDDVLKKQDEIINFIQNHPNNSNCEKYLIRNIFSRFAFYYFDVNDEKIAKDLSEKFKITAEYVRGDEFFIIQDLKKDYIVLENNLRLCIRKKLNKNPLDIFYKQFKQ